MFTPKQPRAKTVENGALAKPTDGSGELENVACMLSALVDIAAWRANHKADRAANNFDKIAHSVDKVGTPTLTLAEDEEQILRWLGAAVIMRWNTIPTKLQRELFDSASSMGNLLQTGSLMGQIAPFLREHKDDDG